ncbi:oxaloacetate decarboxylase, partial [Salmonella enterica subsp. enterica serovar Newport str. SHSN011]
PTARFFFFFFFFFLWFFFFISSMSATYGHPATEALVATLAGTEHDTGLDILKLENIAAYFREVRKKYHAFEGQLKGYDSRILVAQVPGGMLT